ncbi:peroxisomal 2,4-dienoyl-CoA reductase [(3E)-enoyl-CoA-producing]-like isoform X2 [Amphiura filiformis]|uniref:peroxisomal 2,4-dienoyl-CoA reductase [(3E)-enoyl-CoA-producing]-like isoform X2 n=1 Tax=Amphiura filiformis TaxID=82378 RepID=UPI003B21A4CB
MAEEDINVCLTNYKSFFRNDIMRDKVAFVTGGGSGIGFTITETLMRHGCKTVIASRKLDRLRESARKLEAATGQECLAVKMDARNPQDVLAAVDQALSHYGRIDILVNSAAGNFICPASSMSFNAFKTVIEIDTIGTFNVSKAVFDTYLKDHGGVIINISATLPYKGSLFQLHASAAKAAIDSMTKTLCNEWGQYGIRVVGIAPGPIADTEGMRKLAGPMSQAVGKAIPVGRLGTKREVADLTFYMASDAAGFISGATIVVDGGSWMTRSNNLESAKLRMKSLL